MSLRNFRRAVVLLSGGLDSAVALYSARDAGCDCQCLVFDYGQRHKREISAARKLARAAKCPIEVIKISLPWKGSSLLEKRSQLPAYTRKANRNVIPSTYVPGRNLIFLSYALSFAESTGAQNVYIGAHAQDYSGYPDCRPEFFRALSKVVSYGTKAGSAGKSIGIVAPLLHKTKAEIIKQGFRLGVPFGLTWSCYRGAGSPCGRCDSCHYRAKGFKEAGRKDPAIQR